MASHTPTTDDEMRMLEIYRALDRDSCTLLMAAGIRKRGSDPTNQEQFKPPAKVAPTNQAPNKGKKNDPYVYPYNDDDDDDDPSYPEHHNNHSSQIGNHNNHYQTGTSRGSQALAVLWNQTRQSTQTRNQRRPYSPACHIIYSQTPRTRT